MCCGKVSKQIKDQQDSEERKRQAEAADEAFERSSFARMQRRFIEVLADFGITTEMQLHKKTNLDYEQMLRITPKATQTLDDRRAAVEAKWKSAGHIDITLLQAIADSWRNGASAVTFEEGFLVITMISVLGVPEDLDTLLDAISAAAPAHLPLRCVLHYLLIRDIHEVMTLEEMQSTKLSNFAMGR